MASCRSTSKVQDLGMVKLLKVLFVDEGAIRSHLRVSLHMTQDCSYHFTLKHTIIAIKS